MNPRPMVIGTAGHVDHGKTALVRALTGVDLDRLPEEKERGITIALGFTPLPLPSGRVAGLVDVPGHERLVRTMVAGASGMDAVMLCVSAVEGVMPQTREHLAILTLLGVPRGVLVLTKADLVDPDLLELAADELRDQVRGTLLADAPLLVTSATSGEGIEALRSALDALEPPPRDPALPFRLPVDRSFARRGFGTVVTGTTWAGRLPDGAEVELLVEGLAGPGRRVRVRGIQQHGRSVAEAHAGARTALNLAGVEVEDAPRGSWAVAPGTVPSPLVIDTAYHHLADAPTWEGEANLLVLHGTREVPARLVPLDAEALEPGWSGFVQLRLAGPLPCLPGDPFVVRQASPAATVGGGRVLDPYAAVARRSRAAESVPLLRRLATGDRGAWLDRAGAGGLSDAEASVRVGAPSGVRLGDRWFTAAWAESHRRALHEAVADGHRAAPLAPVLNRKSLRAGSLHALGDREFLALIDAEVGAGRLETSGGGVRRPGWVPTLTPEQEAWRARALELVEGSRWEGVADLREKAPHPEYDALIHLLEHRSELAQAGDRLFGRAALDALVQRVRAWFADHPTLDPGAFKDLTGLSRRSAIPLLEWLDAQGITRRIGDERTLRG